MDDSDHFLRCVLCNRSWREHIVLEIYHNRNSPSADKATLDRIPLVSSMSRNGKIHDTVLEARLKPNVMYEENREVSSHELRRPYRSQGIRYVVLFVPEDSLRRT